MQTEEQLKNILDPNSLKETYKIDNLSTDECLEIFKKLDLIRQVEFKLALEKKKGVIKGPVHLSAGQEAIPVGISKHLKKTDYIFGAHRSHAHILALGTSVRKLFAEILGKATGLSKGFGGSMHLIDQSVGFMGSVPIVSGTIPLGVGAALAIKQQKSDSVSIVYLGDGAVEEGTFHESLNLAKIMNLPVVFVVENNLFSSHMNINLRQPHPLTSRFADSNLIEKLVLDGNNVMDIINFTQDAIDIVRKDNKPYFIEAITYRWFGHVDWREDIDVGIDRCKTTLENWKKRCPVKRFSDSLTKNGLIESSILTEIKNDNIKHIDNSWEQALKDPYPSKDELTKYTFS